MAPSINDYQHRLGLIYGILRSFAKIGKGFVACKLHLVSETSSKLRGRRKALKERSLP